MQHPTPVSKGGWVDGSGAAGAAALALVEGATPLRVEAALFEASTGNATSSG
jgi:hypothetical protein